MKKLIIGAILIFWVYSCIPPYKVEYIHAQNAQISPINDLIAENSVIYDVPNSTLIKLFKCESDFRENAVGDNGLAYGIAQFHKQTFEAFAKQEGEKLNYHSTYDQIKLTAWAIANGYGDHWTCYSKAS